MGDAGIVIVTYQSGPLLDRCIASLDGDPVLSSAEVLVVDNASTDGAPQRAAERFARVRLHETGANRGFGTANNIGLSLLQTPYVFLVNPDTEFRDGEAAALLERMDASPRLALSGCRLVSEDGSLQTSMRRLPTVGREASECLFLHRLGPVAARTSETVRDRRLYDEPCSTGWVSGAFMLVRREAMREIGGFDEDFFLYAEEIDLCRRLHDAGWDVGYDPSLTMAHIGGAYTTDPALALENQRSKLRYFLKHEGRARMLAFAGVTALRLLVRGALWGVAGVLGRDDTLRARSRASFATLRRYPALVAGFARMPRPAPRADGGIVGEALR